MCALGQWVVSSMWMLPAASRKTELRMCWQATMKNGGSARGGWLAAGGWWHSTMRSHSRNGPCSLLHTASKWLRALASSCRVQKIKTCLDAAKERASVVIMPRLVLLAPAARAHGAFSASSSRWCFLAQLRPPVDSCHVLTVALAQTHHTRCADNDEGGADVEC
ncbi:hypothetical protein IWZ03DRAFT_138636 [Phyllosticta citriasiana]|uniref:Secreted protein n=1 Tax=Phyllosticta citriasiana TaxID=595635 RepID=A0ABR1KSJ8_9PEZI